ncbi:MAG: hypothetical protein NTW96_16600 [Planctomycetia bacterium]|nr:hypothetical protein [Planctomycetia bacterium]
MSLLPLMILAILPSASAVGDYPGATTVFHCTFDGAWDENYDGWPDGWTRRTGPGYPHYVRIQISDERSPSGNRCLRIDLDGGGAVVSSPPIPVGSLHGYVLRGELKTENLDHDRAFLSLTFLDRNRHRLAAYPKRARSTSTATFPALRRPTLALRCGWRTSKVACWIAPSTRCRSRR